MPLDESAIDRIVARYEREVDRYRKLVDAVEAACTELVREHAIGATVLGRTKAPDHLRRKLRRHASLWDTEDETFEQIKDLAAVRIATFVEGDRPRVAELVCRRFDGPGGGPPTPLVHDSPSSHYRGTHCQVVLPRHELTGTMGNLEGTRCEIQVCSLIAMAFNEIQHDLEYKPMTGSISIDERRHLERLAELTTAADAMIVELIDATDARLRAMSGPFGDQHDFVARMAPRFASSRHFGTHSGPLYRALVALGLDSPRAIVEELLSDESEAEARFMLDQLAGHLAAHGIDRPVLDPDSCDPLLMLLLDRRAEDLARHVETGARARTRLGVLTGAWLDLVGATRRGGAGQA